MRRRRFGEPKRRARDVMEAKVKTVDAELTLADLERVLLAERMSGAPAVAQGK